MEHKTQTQGLPKLTSQEVAANEETLRRINRKISYAKNPRYLNTQTLKCSDLHTLTVSPSPQTTPNPTSIRCDPAQIIFSNFEKNVIYEYEVTLINTSRLIRRIKVPPIASEDFVVSDIKYPKEDSGDIAPGMKVKVAVRFHPKKIDRYEGELVVMTQEGVLQIPIRTVREEPELVTKSEVDVGSCWAGGNIKAVTKVRNAGGDADFVLEAHEGVQRDGKLEVGKFILQPCAFKLKKNQQIDIWVSYSSQNVGISTSTIDITSEYFISNSASFGVKGSSFNPQMEMVSLNSHPPISASKHQKVYFENVVPTQPKEVWIEIKNLASLSLPFRIEISNPSFSTNQASGDFQAGEVKSIPLVYHSDKYVPDFGVAKVFIGDSRESEYHLELIASPQKYSLEVAPSLYIFPDPLVAKVPQNKGITLTNQSPSQVKYRILQVSVTQLLSVSCLDMEGVLMPHQHKRINLELVVNQHDSKQEHRVAYKVQADNTEDLYFELRAMSTLPTVVTNQMIDFGLMKNNTTASKKLRIHNRNSVPLHLTIINKHKYYYPEFCEMYDYSDEDHSFLEKRLELDMESFVLNPYQVEHITCTYWAKSPESLIDSIEIVVEGGINQIVEVMAEVQEPHLLLSTSYFNLKELFVGSVYSLRQVSRKKAPLSLLNLGNIDAPYSFENTETQNCRFEFSPSSGTIASKSKTQIEVKITPLRSHQLNQKIICRSQKIQMEICFQALIKGLEIKYFLADESLAKKVVTKDFPDFTKTEKSRKNYTASMTSGVTQLKEKERFIYPELTKVNFFNCEINIPKQIEVMLENHSDLNAEFQISAVKYYNAVKTEKSKNPKSELLGSRMTPFSSEMGATLIAKRELQKSQKEYLHNTNHGISIVPEIQKGQIQKGGDIKVKITLFNNICGRFSDTLRIAVRNHETREFPIEIEIKGTPICVSKNQVGIDFNSYFPVYKFGTFPTKSGTIRKEFKVVNKGPKAVELLWKMYSIDKPTSSDPFKITLNPPQLGSQSPISINWQAVQPEPQVNPVFKIQPASKRIQPQQQTSFTISFTTPDSASICKCILVGEPYLITDDQQRTRMELMPIVPEAQTVTPVLSMDKYVSNLLDDSIVGFQRHAGEDSQKDSKTVILTNPTDANLICSLQIDSPFFKLIETHSNSVTTSLSKTQTHFSRSINKQATKALSGVENCFNVTPGSCVSVKIKFDVDNRNLQEWPLTPKLIKEGKLLISYANEDLQQIPLLGQLYRPVLRLNTTGKQGIEADEVIDFGIVHANNDRKKAFYLVNTSSVRAKWTLKYVKFPAKRKFQQTLWTKLDEQDSRITDDKDCFNFSANEGSVESLSIPIKTMPNTLALPAPDDNYAKTHAPQKVMICFKPKKDAVYKSKFRIVVEDGEALEFVLKGQGTYEEEYEK